MNEATADIDIEQETGRPEWVHCAKSDRTYYGLCGRFCGWEFMFTDAEHARLSAEHGSRLMLCEECKKALVGTAK